MISTPRPWRGSLGTVSILAACAAFASCGNSGDGSDGSSSSEISAIGPNAGSGAAGGMGSGGAMGSGIAGNSNATTSNNTTGSGAAQSNGMGVGGGTGMMGSGVTGNNTLGSGGMTGSGVNGTGGALGVAGATGGVAQGGTPGSTMGGASTGGTEGGMSGGAAGQQSAGGSGGASGDAGGAGGAGTSEGQGGAGGAAGDVNMCPEVMPLTGGQQYCSNSKGNAGGGYAYELWADGGGSGCMTVYGVDAAFGASWTNRDDFLARVGLDFDQSRTPDQVGTISAEFAETKTDDGGLTYIGIYGWTVNPLREFYILDDWGESKPGGLSSDGTPRDSVGTIMVDGETYDVWKKTRENKPAITGDNMTFDQYFSIRRTARQCGHISVSEHFSKWMDLGLPLGNLVEVKLLLEAQANSGTIEFTTASVVVE